VRVTEVGAVLADQRRVAGEAAVLYLDLHANPELSGAERRTAGRLAGWLDRDGLQVAAGVGGHGVLAALRNGPGPTVLLRAELDALPVAEQTGLRYASTATGTDPAGRPTPVAHACGHDLHLAALAGATRLLATNRQHWSGTLLVAGQPAEETLTGAQAMLADGLLDRFGRPDVALAQHTAPLLAGMVGHGTGGAVTAAGATLAVTVPGRGGHAATPHLTIDPVVTAAAIVLRLQAVVAREVPAAEQAVLTVTDLRAAGGHNLVPDHATLGLTIRALHPATLARVTAAAERVIQAECAASGCERPAEIRVLAPAPAHVPDAAVTAGARAAHTDLFGADRVTGWPPSMATEDFGHLAAAGIRTGYWMLGSIGPRQWAAAPGDTAAEKLAALPANHSPAYAPDLALTLPTGIAALVAAALAHLGPSATRGASVRSLVGQ
jgi:hippurate hydrolase